MKTLVIRFLALGLFALTFGCSPHGWKVEGCSLVPDGPTNAGTEKKCYHDWSYRPASPLSECPNEDRSGLLCYTPCKDGYTGVGPVCWKGCPPGYTDDGAFCRKNAHIISANNDDCPWYDKCGLTFSKGCSKCPEGYKNDGCTCRKDADIFAKDTYWRGIGSPMVCDKGKEQIGALCYSGCPTGYKADGIYCVADKETCVDVPKQLPGTPLVQFCFTLNDPSSWVEPCLPIKVFADTEANARKLAQCRCTNCTVQLITCSDFDFGRGCK